MLSSHSSPDRTVPVDDDPADDIVYPSTGPFSWFIWPAWPGIFGLRLDSSPPPAPRPKLETVLFFY
jgi:hypothetical protein